MNAGQSRYGYVFVSGYTLLLLAFGLLPTLYAIYLAFTRNGAFVGFDNFVRVFGDYRFLPAVAHVALYIVYWLVSLIIFVVILALIVHAVRVRWLGNAARFLFYIPGAIAGASSVLLWLFVLDPTRQPRLRPAEGHGLRLPGERRRRAATCPWSSPSSPSGPVPAAGSSSCTER